MRTEAPDSRSLSTISLRLSLILQFAMKYLLHANKLPRDTFCTLHFWRAFRRREWEGAERDWAILSKTERGSESRKWNSSRYVALNDVTGSVEATK